MLIAMGVALAAEHPQGAVKKYAGPKASVQILGPNLDIGATQTALLTGGSVARAVGSFSYTANRDGTVNPDPAWVASHIRTEEMPIIGRVTGNVVMLPQLRAALSEVVTAGLSKQDLHLRRLLRAALHRPRPVTRPQLPHLRHRHRPQRRDNYRGIAGKMDRSVVSIFKSGASPGAATGTTPTPCTSSWPSWSARSQLEAGQCHTPVVKPHAHR